MTWREGCVYWRAWARQGSDVSAGDAIRMSRFYTALVTLCQHFDDEMPVGLAGELKMIGASTNDVEQHD